MESSAIAAEYHAKIGDCSRLVSEVLRQLQHAIDDAGVTLGTPIEGRVKTLDSIVEKQERKEVDISSVTDFSDLIGIRTTLLFHRDINVVDALIKKTFQVVDFYDNGDKLGSSEFGYQSKHYILKVRDSWLDFPTLRGLGSYVFELQLRTLAQHIWAVSSHKLQYKREASVPKQIRRSINRVSALLEMVDLEFERILHERDVYSEQRTVEDAALNVDLLAKIFDLHLPAENKDEDGENYDELLFELNAHGINTVSELTELYRLTWDAVSSSEKKRALDPPAALGSTTMERAERRHNRGVFFTHVGLMRKALDERFGTKKMMEWRVAHRHEKAGQKIKPARQAKKKSQVLE